MRLLILLLLLVASSTFDCGPTALPQPGDASGGAEDASAGDASAGDASAGDLAGTSCNSLCKRCTSGSCCGPINCCAVGEWCNPSDFSCHCGSGPACKPGQSCATGGPVRPGGGGCGILCCGAGVPCPL